MSTGAVVAWLQSARDAVRFIGKWIYAPKLCEDLGRLRDVGSTGS